MKMKSILIVDDEKHLCDLIAEQVKEMGMEVQTANSGFEAFDKICQQKFDMVISDVRMPGMDGIELLEKVNKELEKPPLFVVITGYSDYSVEEAKKKGALKLYRKPEQLFEMLQDIQQSSFAA